MPPLKYTKVLGYSSEDTQFPASNLINSKGKWRSAENGDKSSWIILELEKLANISHLDVGNYGSAFIEVQVGRQGMSDSEFTTLLTASSFMSPEESRTESNTTRVRMFARDKLNQAVVTEKWNIIKVICTQPFNKHTQYGISFIAVTGVSDAPAPPDHKSKEITLGAFKIKLDDKDDFSTGTYFNKRLSNSGEESGSVAAELRSDKTLASMVLKQAKKEDLRKKEEREKVKERGEKRVWREEEKTKTNDGKKRIKEDLPRRNFLPGEESDDEEERKEKIKKKEKEEKAKKLEQEEKLRKEKERSNEKRNREKKDQERKNAITSSTAKKRKFAAFNKLLDGVIFTISGFQNPLRGEIRGKALKLGAKYRGDWDGTCTHLVCAFSNTPKYNQVKGKGKIVKKDWIEDCFSKRMKLNSKSYALTRDSVNESDEEIYEGNSEPSGNQTTAKPSAQPSSSSTTADQRRRFAEDEDTDDEIERIQRENMERGDDDDEEEDEEDEDNDDIPDNPDLNEKEKESKEQRKFIVENRKEQKEIDTNDDENKENKIKDNKTNMKTNHLKQNPKVEKEENSDAYDAETDAEDSDDAYDAETDIDEGNLKELRKLADSLPLDTIKDFFKEDVFMLKGFKAKETALLERYIVAHGGSISMYNDPSVGIIISKAVTAADIREGEKVNPAVVFLNPDWVFKCVDKQRRVSTNKFNLKK